MENGANVPFYYILENLTFQRPPKVRVNYEFQ